MDFKITWDWLSRAFIVTVPIDSALYNYLVGQNEKALTIDPFIFMNEDVESGEYAALLNHERTHIWQQRLAGPVFFYGSYVLMWITLRGEYKNYNVWEWMAKEISKIV